MASLETVLILGEERKTELGRGGVRGPYMKGMALPACVGMRKIDFVPGDLFLTFFSLLLASSLLHTPDT
jgi:hypothetical protein